MKIAKSLTIFAVALLTLTGEAAAQSIAVKADAQKAQYSLVARDNITLGYDADFTSVAVASNCDYTVESEAEWLKATKQSNGNLLLTADYYYEPTKSRTAKVNLTTADGSLKRTINVTQQPNTAAETLTGDISLAVTKAQASQSQSGEGIERTYDGKTGTFYHSPYYGATNFPVTLTYTLKGAPHVDYILYTPRQDGNSNGNFGNIKVEYSTSTTSTQWETVVETDLGESSAFSRIDLGEAGIDNAARIRISVLSGAGGFASCAEMEFYEKNSELQQEFARYFSDDLYTQLNPGITAEDVAKIKQPFVRMLAMQVLNGYDTEYRVAEYEPYRPIGELASELKVNTYNRYENPTGLYFSKGEKIAVFVKGLGADGANLIIKSFGKESYEGEGHPESSYALQNGVNVITCANRGNGYISYYTSNYATAPNISIHFAMAQVNGVFELGDDNTKWKKLLANAAGDVLDIRTPRMQVPAPIDILRDKCPDNGAKLAQIYDDVIYRQREIMGLQHFNREPKNRQFARPVDSGMFADGIGAGASFGSFGEWVNPDNFGYWGFGHELGHVNQVRPGLKWVGCGETTNNIYSAWCEHTLGSGYHRLEDEGSGIDSYSGWRGGRFQIHLEEGVRKGISWQLQDGADYHGAKPETVNVPGEDYDGNPTGNVTTTKRNYDHFVKVVPLYQLTLFTEACGKSPVAFGKVCEGIRNYPNESSLTNGQLQIKFMRSFCDSTGINFLPFFEKAGMLKPIDAYIEDYNRGWLKISEGMIEELKQYIAEKGYPEAPAALNYINAYNLEAFRDNLPLEAASLGEGCGKPSGGAVQVDGNVWKNAVGYETYDADGNLLHISMYGLGAQQQSKRYTKVLFPSTAKYIMAVGYDGTKVKCFEK